MGRSYQRWRDLEQWWRVLSRREHRAVGSGHARRERLQFAGRFLGCKCCPGHAEHHPDDQRLADSNGDCHSDGDHQSDTLTNDDCLADSNGDCHSDGDHQSDTLTNDGCLADSNGYRHGDGNDHSNALADDDCLADSNGYRHGDGNDHSNALADDDCLADSNGYRHGDGNDHSNALADGDRRHAADTYADIEADSAIGDDNPNRDCHFVADRHGHSYPDSHAAQGSISAADCRRAGKLEALCLAVHHRCAVSSQ